MNTLEKIEHYGISIRQIPKVVISKYAMRHFKEGDEVDGNFCIRKRIPLNAGFWMSQIVNDTSSMVTWNLKRCNLACTLSDSVDKCVENI